MSNTTIEPVTDSEAKTFFQQYVSAVVELTGSDMSEAEQTKSAKGYYGVWKELRRPLRWTRPADAIDFVERVTRGIEDK